LQKFASPEQTITPDKYLNYDATGLQNAAQIAGQQYQDTITPNLATANQNLEFNPYNPQAQGGNIISDPKTLQGLTFAQLGLGGQTANQASLAGDYRMQAGYKDLQNWLSQNNYADQTAVPLSADQQSQIGNLQNQLNWLNGPNGQNAAYNTQAIGNINNQMSQIYNSAGTYDKLNSSGLQASPLQFYESVLNGQDPNLSAQQLHNDWGFWAPGMQSGLDALQNIINANNTYTPTRQLQIEPDQSTS
jgi:hypothetical protein